MLRRRMMAEAIAKGLLSPGQPLKKLSANPHVITTLNDCPAAIERLRQHTIPLGNSAEWMCY
jgi:hypothetical protein